MRLLCGDFLSSILANVIQENREKIRNNKDKYSGGKGAEPRVRTDLLFPILSALGWKIDTNDVEVEHELDSGIADFVLFDSNEPVFVIETKALGKNVGPQTEASAQLLDYMIDLDLYYGSTTDGAIWTLFSRTGRRANLEWSIDLFREDLDNCARLLALLAKSNVTLIDTQVKLMNRKKKTLADSWAKSLGRKEEILEILAKYLRDKASEIIPEIELDDAREYLVERYKNDDFIIEAGHVDSKPPETRIGSRVRPKPGTHKSSPQYWLTPVASTTDESAEEHLGWLVGEDKVYAYGDRTPGREKLKPGDWLCFYASGKSKGVIGHARVTTKPVNRPYPKLSDPKKHPWIFKVDSVNLYPNNPVYINEDLLSKLDYFENRVVDANWGWFVVTTRNISERDFRRLTRNTS